ncbi:ribonuclease Z [Haloimpatiens sp. FM7315]|uniref:ribonuclease Z n=1 Tax=Haloimpatiens sp. FM7315 TaxID=3298609 RepID=UPI003709DF29
MFKISLLGSGGTMPLPGRNLTAMLGSYNGRMILIDCGEGTQVALKSLGWGIKKIDLICLTHYHPDHIVGLPGLLSTMGNSDRKEKVTIMGPIGLKKIIKGMMVILPYLPFELELVEIKEEGMDEFKFNEYTIKAIYTDHSVPCVSYCIEIKRNKKFNKEKAEALNIPVTYWNKIQNGYEVVLNDKVITPDMVLGDNRKGLKVCYCTDTRPSNSIVNFARNSDLFICEGMYGEDTYLEKAMNNKHMLFSEAATMAKKSEAKELWLTHFSPSLNSPEEFLPRAKDIFENTHLGKELMCKDLNFKV